VPLPVKRDWGRLIEGYLQQRDCLRGIVLVMDARHPLTDFDRQMLDWASAYELSCHVLLTKSDKLTHSVAMKTLRDVSTAVAREATVQLFSATAGTGMEEARKRLEDLLGVP
jgi:GTP-binding protein